MTWKIPEREVENRSQGFRIKDAKFMLQSVEGDSSEIKIRVYEAYLRAKDLELT